MRTMTAQHELPLSEAGSARRAHRRALAVDLVVPAEPWHAQDMAPRLRPEDLLEMQAATAEDPELALERAIRESVLAFAWIVEGRVACLFGIALGTHSVIGGAAHPWLMSTALVAQHRYAFLRRYRPYLARFANVYPVLYNYVDARYAKSVRWLRWMGFTLHPAEPYGRLGLPHHRFELRSTR